VNRARVTALLIALTVSGLSACGDDDKSPSSASTAPAVVDAEKADQLYELGETADTGAAEIRVTKVTDPAQGSPEPVPGRRFVAVTFSIASKADVPLRYRAGQFQILGDSSKDFYTEVPDPDGFSGATIAPGKEVTGSMLFDVPIQEKDIRLVVEPPGAEGDVVEIKLAD